MIEQVFEYSTGNEKKIERLLFDENIHYIHMIFNNGDGLPEHDSNATLYMTVVRGKLSIGLDDQEDHQYGAGTLLKIPEGTKMNVRNQDDTVLELVVVKAPAPKA